MTNRTAHDAALLAAVAAGDDAALRELFIRHAPWLAARLRRTLPPHAVEDIVQETFIAVWQSAGRYQGRGAVGAWLWGIAQRQAARWYRRQEAGGRATPPASVPEDPALAAAQRVDLAAAFATLPPEGAQRELAQLVFVEERSVADVAARLGIPEGTVKSRVYALRRALRGRCGEDKMMAHPDEVEHIASCAECQARASGQALDVDLERAWAGVAATVWSVPPGPVERLLGRLFGSPGLARALLITPSLLLSWLIANVVVLAVGVVVTWSTGDPWVPLLAPALMAAGMAYAYGPAVDPAFALGRTMAISDQLILLVRGLAIFAVNALLGLLGALLTANAQATGLTLRWLLPMTMIAALALAVATLTSSAPAGLLVGVGVWELIVVIGALRGGSLGTAVNSAALTLPYLLGLLVAAAVVVWATGERQRERTVWRW